MVIDTETKIFTDLTDDQAMEMLAWAISVVVNGKIPEREPEWLDPLLTILGFYERMQEHNRLLYLSMVLPQRLLLSVTFHMVKMGAGKVVRPCTL